MLDEEICVFFLIGHCSNKHQCKDSHKVKNCPYKGCNPQMCHLRHPPVCKMWSFNVCPYETTCNHLHFFPQSSNTQVVENETILFNLTSLNDKEENVDRTKDLVQKLTKEKEENEKELTMKLGTANANIKDLHKNISKLEGEKKSLEEKAEEQEETLQIKKEEVNSLEARVKTDFETWKSNQTRLEEENQKRVDELQNEVKMMQMEINNKNEVEKELDMVREELKTVHKKRTEITKTCAQGFVTLKENGILIIRK